MSSPPLCAEDDVDDLAFTTTRTLIDAHPFFRLLPNVLFGHLPFLSSYFPKTYLSNAGSVPLLQPHEAKMFVVSRFCHAPPSQSRLTLPLCMHHSACSLLLASMLALRILQPALTNAFKSKPRKALKPKSSAVASKKTIKEKKTQ